jgi:Spy/CpxP family protein refolding chaperone
MKRLLLLAVPLTVLACTTTNDDRPVYQPSRRPPMARATDAALDMLPPPQWWHQPMLADAVRLTPDQTSSLDKIAQDQGNDVARIETDMNVAMRDLKSQLDAAQPASADILAAGQRIRALRDSMFDRQLQLLAAERTVLSLDQWQTLQRQLQERRQERSNDYGPRRGGRGMGGRGRWPGY